MEKQRQIKILSIVALVLAVSAMTLGFAAFSTTLNISSSASVTPNSDSFAVKFSTSSTSLVTDAVVPSSKTTGLTTTNGTIVNSASPTLSNLSATFTNPGQYAEYTVYAINTGEYTAYLNNINYLGNKTCVASNDATDDLVNSACNSINITITINDTTYDDTTPITAHALAKGASEVVKVRLEYASNGTSVDGSFTITFPSIALVYSTVDDSSIQPSTQSKVCTYVDSEDDTGSAIGKIDLSDVVTCGTESFYVMSNEGGTVTMLSMYNLHVGNTTESYNATPLTNPTGIQDSDARGMVEEETIWIGTTAFSNTNPTYAGSIVEGYVNNYKTYLTNMGVEISSARLIRIEELRNLGCDVDDWSCSDAPSWVYYTTYWLETAMDEEFLWTVLSPGYLDAGHYSMNNAGGVRPVIEISETEIKKG